MSTAADTPPRGPGGLLGRLRAARAGRRLDPQRRQEIADQLYFEEERRRPYLVRFAVLSVLSVLIATYGVAADSSPVVIGAMLIAPLMTPLLGLSAALVNGQPARQAETALIVTLAGAGSILVAFLGASALPNRELLIESSSELLSRTSPSMVDLLIGLAAGAAGAYVTVHREAVSALPGAAIAVALIPPLAAVGSALAIGRGDLAEGALLLYLTNLAAIVLAAGVVFVVTGVVARRPEGRFTSRTRWGLATAIGAVLLVSYPLGRLTNETVAEANDQSAAREAAQAWIGDRDLAVLGAEVDGDAVRIDIVGSERPPSAELLESRLSERLGRGVSVTVPWVKSENVGAPPPEGLELAPPGATP